jgi:hypothetical protein
VAVRTNEIGVVVHAAGPFLDERDAKAHVNQQYDGHGYPVSFELIFRAPQSP